jgi:hypothetical protein
MSRRCCDLTFLQAGSTLASCDPFDATYPANETLDSHTQTWRMS